MDSIEQLTRIRITPVKRICLPYILAGLFGISSHNINAQSATTINVDRFIASQLNAQLKYESALAGLLNRYPQHTNKIIYYATTNQTNRYRETFRAIANSNPAYLPDATISHLQQKPVDFENILSEAIRAEPSYADSIISTVIDKYPNKAQKALEITLNIEPELADQFVTSASVKLPNQAIKFLQLVFSKVPYLGPYVLETMVFQLPEHSQELIKESLTLVMNDDVSKARILNCARAIGYSETEIQALITAGTP